LKLFGESFPAADIRIETFGNVLSASSFLYGLAANELTAEELAYTDRGYEVTIGVRLVKPPQVIRHGQRRCAQEKALVLMYHRVGQPGADPFSLSVTPENFSSHMAVLRRRDRVISLRTLGECVRDGNVPDRFVAVSFDDGYADNLHVAKPLMDELRIPATVFITSGSIGGREYWWDALERILLGPGLQPETLKLEIDGVQREWNLGPDATPDPVRRHAAFSEIWCILRNSTHAERERVIEQLTRRIDSGSARPYLSMRADEIARLTDGGWIEIGTHSITHPFLAELPAAVQEREITGSKRQLEEILGRPVTSFAYPYGAFSPETLRLVAAARLNLACTTVAGVVTKNSDPLQLPRVQVCNWDADRFSAQLDEWFAEYRMKG
jgi:peptidoglycan/xylan/chitin deacetylase (PgdA/CDA1 family)